MCDNRQSKFLFLCIIASSLIQSFYYLGCVYLDVYSDDTLDRSYSYLMLFIVSYFFVSLMPSKKRASFDTFYFMGCLVPISLIIVSIGRYGFLRGIGLFFIISILYLLPPFIYLAVYFG